MGYEVTKVTERVWAIQDGNVRAYLLDGGGEALLIDTGYGSGDLAALAAQYCSGPVAVVNTHSHGDHTSGNKQFRMVYVGEKDREEVEAACLPDAAVISVKDWDRITAGEITLRVIAIPGHTAGSIALLDEDRRLLFTGDAVAKGWPVYMQYPVQDKEKYLASLYRLKALDSDYDRILPCHGELVIGKEYLDRTIRCCEGIPDGTLPEGMAPLYDGSPARAAWYEDVAILY